MTSDVTSSSSSRHVVLPREDRSSCRTPAPWPRPRGRCGRAPMIPSCLPRSSVPSMKSSAQPFHPPARIRRSPSATRRAIPRIKRPGELRVGFGQHVRRVGDDDAALAHGGDVDVVVADGDVGDDLQRRRRVHELAVDPVGQHADQRVLVGDAPQQLVAGNGACRPCTRSTVCCDWRRPRTDDGMRRVRRTEAIASRKLLTAGCQR